MNRYWLLLIILLGILFIAACEKDDICVDGDTPFLIIRFYDQQNPENAKSVSSLRVIGLGQEGPVNTFSDRSNTDSIAIPLRPNQPDAQFIFILDSADEEEVETGNKDTLAFLYSTEEVFVSRACGFIANYSELNAALIADTLNWIQNIEISNPSITKQDSAHVKIYH